MTDFKLPPLAVDYDERWVEVDLRGDLGAWARHAAREVLTRAARRGDHVRADQKRIVAVLEGAGNLARGARDASIALLLYPAPDEGVKAVLRFCPVDLAGREGEEAWNLLLSALAPTYPGEDPPEVAEISTGAGLCRRVTLRYASGEGNERPVGEHISYVWVLERYGAGVIMTTAFNDLLEAGRWRYALDALAASVELEQVNQ